MVLRVLAAHRPPLCFIEGGENGSQPIFSGFLIDLLPTLLNQANLQLIYNLTAYVGSGGELQANGTWTGVMGELTSGQTDLALFPLTLTSQRSQYIQSTPPYMDDGYGILVKTRRMDSGYSFLLPFTGLTWAMLMVALVATMLLLTLLDAVTRNARLHAFERLHGAKQLSKKRKDAKIMSHAIGSVMMAVGSGAAPTSRSWAVKIVYISWAVFCVIMLAAYTANLTANMTVSQLGVSFKTLQDLAQSSLPFGVPGDSSVAAYFMNSTDQVARMLRPKMRDFKSTVEGAEAIRQGQLSAFINDYATVQYFTQEPPCDLALSPQTIGSGQLVLGLPRNSSLLQPLSAALLQLSEAGYMAELRRKWFVQSSQCTSDDMGTNGSGQLHLTQAWSVFMIVAGGAAVGLLAAAGEMLYYRGLYTRVFALKQDVSVMGARAAFKKRVQSGRHITPNSSVQSNRSMLSNGTPPTSFKSVRFRESLERSVDVERWGSMSDPQRQPSTALGRYSQDKATELYPSHSPDALATPQQLSDQRRMIGAGSASAAGGGASSQQHGGGASSKHHLKLTAQLLRQAQQELQQLHKESQEQHYAELHEEFLGMGGASLARSVGGQTDMNRRELISTESDDDSSA